MWNVLNVPAMKSFCPFSVSIMQFWTGISSSTMESSVMLITISLLRVAATLSPVNNSEMVGLKERKLRLGFEPGTPIVIDF